MKYLLSILIFALLLQACTTSLQAEVSAVSPTQAAQQPTSTPPPTPDAQATAQAEANAQATLVQAEVNAQATTQAEQVIFEATKNAQEAIDAQATAQALEKMTVSPEQVDSWLATSEVSFRQFINAETGEIQNQTDLGAFEFSEGILKWKSIKDINLSSNQIDTLSAITLGFAAKVQYETHGGSSQNTYSNLFPDNVLSINQANQVVNTVKSNRPVEIDLTAIDGSKLTISANSIRLRYVTMKEFDRLESQAQSMGLKVAVKVMDTDGFMHGSIAYVSKENPSELVITGYDMGDARSRGAIGDENILQSNWPFETINSDAKPYQKYWSFMNMQSMIQKTFFWMIYGGKDLSAFRSSGYARFIIKSSFFCQDTTNDACQLSTTANSIFK